MSNEEKIHVRYVGNAEGNDNTEIITFTDDRESIPVGGKGDLTQDEYANLSKRYVLEIVEKRRSTAKASSGGGES